VRLEETGFVAEAGHLGPLRLRVENGLVTAARGAAAGATPIARVVGRELSSLVHADDDVIVKELLQSAYDDEPHPTPVVVRFRMDDGELLYVEVVVERLAGAGDSLVDALEIQGWDVTRHVRRQQALEQVALHDSLTGLANRALFNERMHEELRRQRRTSHEVAVLYADLDGFKNVNDTWGHRAGDLLLTALAHRLRGCLRPGDTLARLGGDEFAVCCPDLNDAEAAMAVAHRLIDAATAPVSLGGAVVRVAMSVGVAMAIESDLDDGGTQLVARADLAMYAAKHAGHDRVALSPTPAESA
jgi:diguanylate cyclase (GGDEF)-like protein